jgi:hypothetical protein
MVPEFSRSANGTAFRGIYVGRVPSGISSKDTDLERRLFEAQIGIVWSARVADEIIDGGVIAPHSNQFAVSHQVLDTAIAECAPDLSKPEEQVANQLFGQLSLDFFGDRVMRHLKGRADPEDVKARVLEYVRNQPNWTSPEAEEWFWRQVLPSASESDFDLSG